MRRIIDVRLNLQPLIDKKSIKIHGRTGAITQKEIAEATHIPQGTLSRWQNGKVDSFKGEILASLMNYFECELADLFAIEVETISQ